MMSRESFYLAYITERIELIEQFTSAGKTDFFEDARTRDAVLRNLELIGATVKRLIESDLPALKAAAIRLARDTA